MFPKAPRLNRRRSSFLLIISLFPIYSSSRGAVDDHVVISLDAVGDEDETLLEDLFLGPVESEGDPSSFSEGGDSFQDGVNVVPTVTGTAPAAPVTGTAPAAPVTGTVPAAPVTGTAPAAPVTGTAPAAPVTGTVPAAPVTGTVPAAPVTGTAPAAPTPPRSSKKLPRISAFCET